MKNNKSTVLVMDVLANDYERSRAFACIYCGNTTEETRDHVVPISWSGHGRHYEKGSTVPSCMECNRILGDAPIFSISGRANYLASKLQIKYRKILNCPDWDEEEYKEMDQGFQKQIDGLVLTKSFIKRRIDHCYLVSLDDIIISEVKQFKILDVNAYQIFNELKWAKSFSEVYKRHKISEGRLKTLLNSNMYSNIQLVYKHENDIPFEVDLYNWFRFQMEKNK